MEVTRDIVLDLLPLYRSGEASGDTKVAVEEYLRRDPVLKRLADAGDDDTSLASARPADNVERSAVERTRRRLRARSWTLAFAILCTLLPFSFADLSNGFTFVMFRDVPWSRGLWVVAVVLWIVYARLQRGARIAGF